ncbi:MAG: aminotransferase class I/II-fold pyridoxal phosphate-dependent enzyme [Pseudomonadales bacterium]
MKYAELAKEELQALNTELEQTYESLRQRNLKLDLTRGKPAAQQLDLSNALDGILEGYYLLQDGTDVRNYGGLEGIPEARELGGVMLDCPAANILVGGNSSLSLMHSMVGYMMDTAWYNEESIKFICPVPGYDRHFTICDHFNIEMIPVPLNDDGPDMVQVEELVSADPTIKGIWCVPKYSNPTGITYSDAVVTRIAKLGKIAGDNFMVMWDNAYAVHHLKDEHSELANIFAQAAELGTQDNIAMFASTSKVTFAGAGISFLALSANNLKGFLAALGTQTIGNDKVNQLRHVRFLQDADGIAAHMEKHRALIEPKFNAVLDALNEQLGGLGIATWTEPRGGYFISLNSMPGLASEIVRLAGEIGVKLTPAGATFPHGQDPQDENIRVAPTFPTTEELETAVNVFITCIKLASVRQLLDTIHG